MNNFSKFLITFKIVKILHLHFKIYLNAFLKNFFKKVLR